MEKIIDRFVMLVFNHPNEDICNLMNSFIRTLTSDELREIDEMIPVVLSAGEAARDTSDEMKKLIQLEIAKECM